MLNYGLSSPIEIWGVQSSEGWNCCHWNDENKVANFTSHIQLALFIGGPKQQELRTQCLGRSIISQMIEFGSHFTRMNQLKQAHDPFTSWSHSITWRRRHIPSCQLGIEFGVRFSKIVFQQRAQRTKVVPYAFAQATRGVSFFPRRLSSVRIIFVRSCWWSYYPFKESVLPLYAREYYLFRVRFALFYPSNSINQCFWWVDDSFLMGCSHSQ